MSRIIQQIIEQELRQKGLFYPFIADLTAREKAVLELRKSRTFEQVGEKFGISRQRVQQVEKQAKAKIDFQREIVEKLACKIGEFVFEEGEVERAFIYYCGGDAYPEAKLEWLKFNKLLWENKKNANRNLRKD